MGLSRNGYSVVFISPPTNLPRDVQIEKPLIRFFTDPIYYALHSYLFRKGIINSKLVTVKPSNYFGSHKDIERLLVILNQLLVRSVNLALFRSTKIDTWIFFEPIYSYFVLPFIKGGKIVYDCADDSSAFSSAPPCIGLLENYVSSQAQATIVTSKRLYDRLSRFNKKCFYVPNAADFEHFNSALRIKEKPIDISHLQSPILGFIGAVYDWIDVDLLCEIASKHPDYSILIVGPVEYGWQKLKKHANILMVGRKDYNVLPQYLAFMDVCLIPFKVNKLTLASNPIKFYEYLAAGKPVVSTALPEIVDSGSNISKIAQCRGDFVKKVEEAVNEISDDSKKRLRIQFAKDNSWEKRTRAIMAILDDVS
jgi:glycosyltransferase involved in cell wall biosynthesis